MNKIDKLIDRLCKWFLRLFKNEKTREKLSKIFNPEVVTYIIAGVLTTVVNWIVSYILNDLCHITLSVLTTAIAWVAAVAFAYWINNFWVFKTGNEGLKKEITKIWKFTLSRVATGVIEIGGMFLFVDILKLPFWPVKIIISIAVIVLNYVFSKLFVFLKSNAKQN